MELSKDFPKPARIKISYDQALQEITGKSGEEAWVSEGLPFLFFLKIILSSYPEIENRYPPGILGFAVNGMAPLENYPLKEGDRVEFLVPRNQPEQRKS